MQVAGFAALVGVVVWHGFLIRRNLQEIRRREALNALLLQICQTAWDSRTGPILQAWADVTGHKIQVRIVPDDERFLRSINSLLD